MSHTQEKDTPPHPPGARERARGLGGFLCECVLPEGLTAEEVADLEAAKAQGFLIRSGKRLAVLAAWRSWCQQAGRRCIVGIVGARIGIVEVGGYEVDRVPVGNLRETLAALRRMKENSKE